MLTQRVAREHFFLSASSRYGDASGEVTADYAPVAGRSRDVKLDAIDERVLVDRPRVSGAPTERLAVGLARASHVASSDRRERKELDDVDLNLARADPIAAALPDLRPFPQPDRDRDVGD